MLWVYIYFVGSLGAGFLVSGVLKYVWNIFTPTFNQASWLGVNHRPNEADDERNTVSVTVIHQSELFLLHNNQVMGMGYKHNAITGWCSDVCVVG